MMKMTTVPCRPTGIDSTTWRARLIYRDAFLRNSKTAELDVQTLRDLLEYIEHLESELEDALHDTLERESELERLEFKLKQLS